jgi:hypothetical protein
MELNIETEMIAARSRKLKTDWAVIVRHGTTVYERSADGQLLPIKKICGIHVGKTLIVKDEFLDCERQLIVSEIYENYRKAYCQNDVVLAPLEFNDDDSEWVCTALWFTPECCEFAV